MVLKRYSDYLSGFFPGIKVQKISVNAGFSCPNRDGKIGRGGCSYCRNDSFSPSYCMAVPGIAAQIEEGKRFFRRKYPEMKYLVYFQSYTNTYSSDPHYLAQLYSEAVEADGVVGLAIGTRPDTLPDGVVELLAEINRRKPVFLEIGAESACDETLSKVNRGHTWAQVEDAVERAARRGLHCGLHLIAGLPGEDSERILKNVEASCRLPVETLKIHQLQILEGTPLHRQWLAGETEVTPFGLDDYLELCVRIARAVPPHIVIERFLAQSPPGLVAAPRWGLKNYQFMDLLRNRLKTDRKKQPDLRDFQ